MIAAGGRRPAGCYNSRVVSLPLAQILSTSEGPARTAALVEWFQSLFEGSSVPVLVGGAAVELYTAGAYVTGDLDFAGDLTPAVERRLRDAGFEKQGRTWRLRDEVFLELPASQLEPGARAVRLAVGERTVIAIALEELLLDRLAAWKHWRSEVDAVNALLLWVEHHERIDRERLAALAGEAKLDDALASLLDFAERHRRRPPDEEIEEWARQRFS